MSEKLYLTNDDHFHEHKFVSALDKNELHFALIMIVKSTFFSNMSKCIVWQKVVGIISLIQLLDYRNLIRPKPYSLYNALKKPWAKVDAKF